MKKTKVVIAIILAVVILIVGVGIGFIFGKFSPDKSKPAPEETTSAGPVIDLINSATVNNVIKDILNKNITEDEYACEYEFYYNSVHDMIYKQSMQYEQYGAGMGAMYTGYDCSKLPESQTYPGDDYKLEDGSAPTWKQYFEYTAVTNLQKSHFLEALAEKEGFVVDESVLNDAYASIEDLKVQVKNQSGDAPDAFEKWLRETYGDNMTEAAFKDITRRHTVVNEYFEHLLEKYTNNFQKNNTALEAEYRKNPDLYNCTDFRIFAINSSDYSSRDEAKNKASEMLSKITDEASFKKLAEQYASKEQRESTDFTQDEATLMKYVGKSVYQDFLGNDTVNWLFDEERKTGDKNIFEYEGYYYIFLMVKPAYRDDATIPADVRHILFAVDGADAQAQKAAAEAAAKAIKAAADPLALFLSYNEKSNDDTASAENGGLFEYIVRGKFVQPFEDWSLDPNRKPGDVDVIETEYGYHVMYFVKKHNVPMWKITISQQLTEKEINTMFDDVTASEEYKFISDENLDKLNEDIYGKIVENYYADIR